MFSASCGNESDCQHILTAYLNMLTQDLRYNFVKHIVIHVNPIRL
jgi:hypothetical protein